VSRGGGGVNGWLREHAPVLGLAGVILATLLIGLLIGHWATSSSSDDAPAKAAAPVVVRVPATAAAAAPAAGTATTATDGASSGGDSADSGAKSSSKSSKSSAKASDSAAKTTAKAPANAVSTKALSNLSGQDKEKAIEKAAKKGQPIATGDGKLPPTDSKAPAGGAGFETIG
jgi:hypothetical protein